MDRRVVRMYTRALNARNCVACLCHTKCLGRDYASRRILSYYPCMQYEEVNNNIESNRAICLFCGKYRVL